MLNSSGRTQINLERKQMNKIRKSIQNIKIEFNRELCNSQTRMVLEIKTSTNQIKPSVESLINKIVHVENSIKAGSLGREIGSFSKGQ